VTGGTTTGGTTGGTTPGAIATTGAVSVRRFAPLGRSTRKYLRKNSPSRPCKGPPQERQATSQSGTAAIGASTLTRRYCAPQPGQVNGEGWSLSMNGVCPMASWFASVRRKGRGITVENTNGGAVPTGAKWAAFLLVIYLANRLNNAGRTPVIAAAIARRPANRRRFVGKPACRRCGSPSAGCRRDSDRRACRPSRSRRAGPAAA
jgi:hypothetical protein